MSWAPLRDVNAEERERLWNIQYTKMPLQLVGAAPSLASVSQGGAVVSNCIGNALEVARNPQQHDHVEHLMGIAPGVKRSGSLALRDLGLVRVSHLAVMKRAVGSLIT
jgi:hypothetical protein